MLIFFQSDFNLLCKKSNRRLEFFFSFASKKVRHGYRGVGGLVFVAKYTLNLPYIFIQENPIFYIIFVKSGLTACHQHLTKCNIDKKGYEYKCSHHGIAEKLLIWH
jgi:hypothetical protein